jgi:hypothetical protein
MAASISLLSSSKNQVSIYTPERQLGAGRFVQSITQFCSEVVMERISAIFIRWNCQYRLRSRAAYKAAYCSAGQSSWSCQIILRGSCDNYLLCIYKCEAISYCSPSWLQTAAFSSRFRLSSSQPSPLSPCLGSCTAILLAVLGLRWWVDSRNTLDASVTMWRS